MEEVGGVSRGSCPQATMVPTRSEAGGGSWGERLM